MNNELVIKMITDSWRKQLIACNKILDHPSDEELLKEVAPGRNQEIFIRPFKSSARVAPCFALKQPGILD